MKSEQKERFLNEQNHMIQLSETCENNIHIDVDVSLLSSVFVDFQKEIFQDNIAQLIENYRNEKKPSEKGIKKILEETLQKCNSELNVFANKMAKVDFFEIKGSIKVLYKETLMASLIGNVSMMIMRNEKLFYTTNNDYQRNGKIDVFSEFVEGDIETGDTTILIGNDIYKVFDKKEIKKFNQIVQQQNSSTIDFLQEAMAMRIPEKEIEFLIVASYRIEKTDAKEETREEKLKKYFSVKRRTQKQKFGLSIALLGIIIAILAINIISQSVTNNYPSYVDETGKETIIKPDSIKKDIAHFQVLDPSSDEKSHLYRQITEQLDYVESQNFRPEDIQTRRRVLEKHYNKGFNIVYETAMSNFDDELNGIKAEIISFNGNESSTIGEPKSIIANSQITVGGTQGALIGVVNGDIRGTLVSHTEEEELIECSSNILRDGLYCYTDNGNIYNLNKAGSVAVTTETPGGFPGQLEGIGIFGKTNLYTLTSDPFLNSDGVYVSRYRNIVGSQTQFQSATDYPISFGSGGSAPSINNLAIDGTFLVRNNENQTIEQRRREGVSVAMNTRTVEIVGGDTNQTTYGEKVKIISNINTRYVYLFDQDNQTLTIYDSSGLKTNDRYTNDFKLIYIMKFKFALGDESIIDIAINEADGNKARGYVVTNQGVYKIRLFEFIDEVRNNENN